MTVQEEKRCLDPLAQTIKKPYLAPLSPTTSLRIRSRSRRRAEALQRDLTEPERRGLEVGRFGLEGVVRTSCVGLARFSWPRQGISFFAA